MMLCVSGAILKMMYEAALRNFVDALKGHGKVRKQRSCPLVAALGALRRNGDEERKRIERVGKGTSGPRSSGFEANSRLQPFQSSLLRVVCFHIRFCPAPAAA